MIVDQATLENFVPFQVNIFYTPYGERQLLVPKKYLNVVNLNEAVDLRIGNYWVHQSEKNSPLKEKDLANSISDMLNQFVNSNKEKSSSANKIKRIEDSQYDNFRKVRKKNDLLILDEIKKDTQYLARSIMVHSSEFAFKIYFVRSKAIVMCVQDPSLTYNKLLQYASIYHSYDTGKALKHLHEGGDISSGISTFLDYLKTADNHWFSVTNDYVQTIIRDVTSPYYEVLDDVEERKYKQEFLNLLKQHNITDADIEQYLSIRESILSPVILPNADNKWFFTTLHAKPIDAIASMTGKKPKEKDEYSQKLIFMHKDVKLTTPSAAKLGTAAHKLLIAACQQLTKNINMADNAQNTSINRDIQFTIEDYAKRCNYDISNDRNKKRIKQKLSEAVRTVLLDGTLSWQDKRGNMEGINIFEFGQIKGNYVKLKFTETITSYFLQQRTITQGSEALFRLDDRSNTAYALGYNMNLHSHMANNVELGTNNILSVQSLLAYTALPTIQKIRESGHSWVNMIKNPLEQALNNLVECEFITKWYYCRQGSKNSPVAVNEITYEEWEQLFIVFEIKNPPDYLPMLERRTNNREITKQRQELIELESDIRIATQKKKKSSKQDTISGEKNE